MIIGGIIAAPFTGGASLAGTAAGVATIAGLTLTITAAELAILCGCGLGIYGIKNKCKVSYSGDGSVVVEPTYN